MMPAVQAALGRRTRRLVLASLAAALAAATLIAPAGAGEVTVQVAPTSAPAGTPITLTASAPDTCPGIAWSFTMADARVVLTGSALLAWNTGTTATMPAPPAEAVDVPADGWRVFLGVGCFGADGEIASVACVPLRLLPADGSASGSATASFVADTTLTDTDHSLSACERRNGVPTVLIPSHLQSIMNRVNVTWQALLAPVAATTTTTSTTVPPPITTPTTAAPVPTTAAP